MMSVLVINRSDSYHKACGPSKGNTRPDAHHCPNCHETFTQVTSDYAGGGIEDWIRTHRPDLEATFPFEGFWKSREGEELLAELDGPRFKEDSDE